MLNKQTNKKQRNKRNKLGIVPILGNEKYLMKLGSWVCKNVENSEMFDKDSIFIII